MRRLFANKKGDDEGIWKELAIIIVCLIIIGAIVYAMWQVLPK